MVGEDVKESDVELNQILAKDVLSVLSMNPLKNVLIDAEMGFSQSIKLFFKVLPQQIIIKRSLMVVGCPDYWSMLIGLYIYNLFFHLYFFALQQRKYVRGFVSWH